MRVVLGVLSLLAFAWGGYWYVGSTALHAAFEDWFDARRAEGWQADYAALDVRGFPNRFDTTLTGLALADPETGWAWTTPFFQIFALSYDPRHIIAVWPHAHTFATPDETVEIASTDMRGSIAFASVTRLELDHTQIVVQAPKLNSTAGWSLSASELRAAGRRNETVEHGYDWALTAFDLAPGGTFRSMAAAFDLPETFRDFRFDATVGFSKPWDRSAVEIARPQPRSIDLKIAKAEWGDMLVQAAGALEIDEEGTPTGEIALQLRNWRTMLDLLQSAGALPVDLRPTVEATLELLAGITGNPDHIDVTLNYRFGFVSVGLVPIGPAPAIRLR